MNRAAFAMGLIKSAVQSIDIGDVNAPHRLVCGRTWTKDSNGMQRAVATIEFADGTSCVVQVSTASSAVPSRRSV
jgi:hypothetical protein